MTLILGRAETERLIDMSRALKAVEGIFRDRAEGKVQSLPRRRLKGSQKQLNVMAAYHAGWDLLCLRAYAMPTNTITLYSGRRGSMEAIFAATYLSSLRTGAASGVAAKYLAPPEAKTLGLVGPGWQAIFQVEAIVRACGVREVMVFGRDRKKTGGFIKQVSSRVRAKLAAAERLEEVEASADILLLATDATSPLTDGDRLKGEALVISMGANQPVKHEVSATLIRRMDLVVTDDLPTAQTDSGDLIAACNTGLFRWEDVRPLESIVVEGGVTPRPKRILFQSNGIADEDLAVARYALRQVRRSGFRAKKIAVF
jgi:ornithine cyclodeaminase/alanine dehydrogenase-like protein (mu-crystallin family)